MNHRPADGILRVAYRWARVVGRRVTKRYRRESIDEGAAMEQLLQAGIVRQHESGAYYLDETVVDVWTGGRR